MYVCICMYKRIAIVTWKPVAAEEVVADVLAMQSPVYVCMYVYMYV